MKPPKLTNKYAVFLDLDGTLIDIAPTPDAVVVPPELPGLLADLKTKLNGAVAILSGRKLADIDKLAGKGFACAAEHGAILRSADGVLTRNANRPAAYEDWRLMLESAARQMPGVFIEEKELSLVAHYRRAPEHEAELGQLVEKLVGQSEEAVLLLAHCAFEIKPRGGNKGDALASFMAAPPFAGRIPAFVGDDVTDEPAIRKAIDLGGAGLHVARDFGGSTQKVREWLKV